MEGMCGAMEETPLSNYESPVRGAHVLGSLVLFGAQNSKSDFRRVHSPLSYRQSSVIVIPRALSYSPL